MLKSLAFLLLCTQVAMANVPSFIREHSTKYTEQKTSLKKRNGKFLTERLARKLSRIHRFIAKDDFKSAETNLVDMSKKYADQPNALSNILEQMGFVYAQTGKYAKAIKAFNQAIGLNKLSYQQTMYAMYTTGQLYLAQEKYQKAKTTLDQWLGLVDTTTVTPQAWMIMASIYAQVKQKEKALSFVELAITSPGQKVKESWMQLAVSLSFELKKWKQCELYLKKLTEIRPEQKKYWKQWWGLYLTQYKDKEALAVMDMAEKLGHIVDQDDYRQLVQMYLFLNQPIKAANTIENLEKTGKWSMAEVKDIKLKVQAYHMARLPLETAKVLKKYATKFKKGEGYHQLALIYFEQFQWEKAMLEFEKAISAGSDNKQLLFYAGQAAFELKRFQKAFDFFNQYEKKAGDQNQVAFWKKESNRMLNQTF